MSSHIHSVRARQILDSRGRPTVEVDLKLHNGIIGRASVPSGASTGTAEACELRDGDPRDYAGLAVGVAVANVHNHIAPALRGLDVARQREVDERLRDLDGTLQLTRLGANAVLATSLAASRAAAADSDKPLYLYLAELAGTAKLSLPMPMVNILSGGLHASRGMDIQDFLAIPASARSIAEAINMMVRVRNAAADVMANRGLSVLLADEGGLSPNFSTSRQALDLMMEAIVHAGLSPGTDVVIALDMASTSLYDATSGEYRWHREGRRLSSEQVISEVQSWVREFPIVSVEDALNEEDWSGWAGLTKLLGRSVRLVGDDLFSTNPTRLARGIREGCANGVLIKINQNGTLTGTLDVIAQARKAGYAPIVSARSGETEDSYIADLAVGTAAGQIKIGSMRCSDRLAKYNQLLRIEEATHTMFAGMSGIRQLDGSFNV